MCLPFWIAFRQCVMPAPGMPVASTITSISDDASRASALSATTVPPLFTASPTFAAAYCAAGQPALLSWSLARATLISATPTTCSPSVLRACVRNIVPNLPAPIRPIVTGRPAAFRSSSSVCRFTRGLPIFSGRWQIAVRSESLLADGARDERLVAAFLRIGRAAFAIHLRRALEGRGDVNALAAPKTLRFAERQRGAAAIRRAVRRNRADFVPGHDVGARQSRDR